MESQTLENLTTATAFSSFAVKPLAEVSKIELESGQYLCRKIEKETGLESKGVIVTAVSPETVVAALENDVVLSGVVSWYQKQVEEVVKSLIAAGATTIIPSDYSQEKVVEYLTAKEVAQGRISKERLESWFDQNLSPVLYKAFTEKFPELATQPDKLTLTVSHYKGVVAGLSKKELSLDVKVIENAKKAFALLGEQFAGNVIVKYCLAKLETAAPKSADMLAL